LSVVIKSKSILRSPRSRDTKITPMPHTVIVGAGIIGVSTAYFLSHSPLRNQDHTITIQDPSPPASGASGKAAGFIARNWTGSATASLEDLSFRLHKELSQNYGGAEKWGYRQCRVVAAVGGTTKSHSERLQLSDKLQRHQQTEYSGELNWIKPKTVSHPTLLGEPESFAQMFIHC
jgi:glycine/D-amino acid oxidase-like deaminating enzyme